MTPSSNNKSNAPVASAQNRLTRWRNLKDRLAKLTIGAGGLLVLLAILVIFFYLAAAVAPLFKSATAEPMSTFSETLSPTKSEESDLNGVHKENIVLRGVEEYGDLAYFLTPKGEIFYRQVSDGRLVEQIQLPLAAGESILFAHFAEREEQLVSIFTDQQRLILVRQSFVLNQADGNRKITPTILFPYGETGIDIDVNNVHKIKSVLFDDRLLFATIDSNNRAQIFNYQSQFDWQSGETSFVLVNQQTIDLNEFYKDEEKVFIEITPQLEWIYLIGEYGKALVLDDNNNKYSTAFEQVLSPFSQPVNKVTSTTFLLGGISLLIGDSNGNVTQWFTLRNKDNKHTMLNIRSFKLADAPVTHLLSEQRRKGFLALDNNGTIANFFTTSDRELWRIELEKKVSDLRLNPRASVMLVSDEEQLTSYQLDNPHPEISWSALWKKVWYESYPEPDYVYQSSAANIDFEKKFSLAPLGFGTLKAAFYALLIAIPIAICGAIFTAYFMAPKMRAVVKPTVEVMEALPTVVIGFLAGLWLAPIIENYLAGFFLTLIILPIAICVFGLIWSVTPRRIKIIFPTGWHAALLIPIVLLATYISFKLSMPIEQWLFDGNTSLWLEQRGIDYEQRNALIVGIAMGFAVIPTIFSIAEDALSSVPKHLSDGSLALGASAWQTLVKVVFPTASPGIFSAVMIGFGRAIGETMIVLMATGNTPILNASIFEGFRSLAANIAIEMPESQVDSTHYRLLFLAALLLFVFTFLVNSIAENVRFRLRQRYREL